MRTHSARLRVMGISYRPHSIQAVVRGLRIGDELRLASEPTNAFDKWAVQVLSGDRHIGYVPATFSKAATKIIADGLFKSAVYRGNEQFELEWWTPKGKADAEAEYEAALGF